MLHATTGAPADPQPVDQPARRPAAPLLTHSGPRPQPQVPRALGETGLIYPEVRHRRRLRCPHARGGEGTGAPARARERPPPRHGHMTPPRPATHGSRVRYRRGQAPAPQPAAASCFACPPATVPPSFLVHSPPAPVPGIDTTRQPSRSRRVSVVQWSPTP
jgi:hypothetical protein